MTDVTSRRNADLILACLCLSLRIMLVTVLFEVLTPLLPLIGHDLELSQPSLQAVLSVSMILGALFSLCGHWVVDRVGRREMVALSAILVCALGLLTTVVTSGLTYATILPAIFAVNAWGSVASRALLRDLSGERNYSKVFAYGQAGLEAACIVAPLVGGVTAMAWGWRPTFAAFCLALLLIPLMVAWAVPAPVAAHNALEPRRHDEPVVRVFHILLHKRCLAPVLLLCATQSSYSALLVATPFLLVDRFDMSVVAVGAMLSGFAGIGILGYLGTGSLVARIGEHRCVQAGVFLQGVSACTLTLLTLLAPPTFVMFTTALIAAQLGYCLVVPAANAWAMNVPEESRVAIAGTIIGLQALAGGGAALIASLTYDGSATSLAVVSVLAAAGATVLNIKSREAAAFR